MIVVDFYTSPACPNCNMLKNTFEEFSNFFKKNKINIREFNPILVQEDADRAERYGVMAAPTVIVKRDGEVVLKLVRERPDEVMIAIRELVV